MRLGAIATPINFRLSAGETAHVLADSRPPPTSTTPSWRAVAGEALERSSHAPAWTAVVGAGAAAGRRARLRELLAEDAEPPPRPPGDGYVETTRLYTSGTTGMPKGVSLNDLVEVASAHDVAMHFPLSPGDRTLNMTPWFHRGGLYSGGPNPVFYVGAEAVSLRAFDPAAVLDLVAARELTFLVGAPTNLAMLAAEQRRQPRDLDSLRGIVTMGAPLEREACLLYQEVLTPRIFNGYGTTESFWNTFLRPEDLPAHAGSAGRACTDDDVVVARSDGESGGRPRRPGGARRRGGRRGRRPHPEGGLCLRQQSRGAGGAVPRRLVPHGRPRDLGRGGLRHDRRPRRRHADLRRRERPPDPGRGGAERASPGRRLLRGRAARRALGRADRRLRGGGGRGGRRAPRRRRPRRPLPRAPDARRLQAPPRLPPRRFPADDRDRQEDALPRPRPARSPTTRPGCSSVPSPRRSPARRSPGPGPAASARPPRRPAGPGR